MLFSSFSFLFWFLPLILFLYFFPPRVCGRLQKRQVRAIPYQNGVLLVGGLLFYAWGEPRWLLLLVGAALTDTLLGLLMQKGRPRLWLSVGLILHIGLLLFFKYAAFLLPVMGFSVQIPPMPLGLSFYTFQSLTYLADVYRGAVPAEKDPTRVGLYLCFFPTLLSGPIRTYKDAAASLRHRTHSLTGAAVGLRRFAAGLCKKTLLAAPMGALFATLTKTAAPTALGAWGALSAFAFQIYFDFSGYSDMAIGLARLFGFRVPENFRYPYLSRSITDFWRRWHITLSRFFREYVYFPLGGSRRGLWRTLGNLLIVWALTGLWHGSTLNFLLWGLWFFLLLTLEKFVFPRFFRPVKGVMPYLLTGVGILFGWLIFAFDGSSPTLAPGNLPAFFLALFGKNGLWDGITRYEVLRHLPLFFLCALGATPWPKTIYRRTVYEKRHFWVSLLLPLTGILLSLCALAGMGFQSFLYFKF